MAKAPRDSVPLHKLKRIGRFRIVRPLSKGGMAMVYEAVRESIEGVSPRVAIKLILPDFAASSTFQELFKNEARVGALLQHQNLVQIQEFDRDPESDSFYIVMEYVEGITLQRAVSLCKRSKLPIPAGVIAELGRQVCDGLDHAHNAVDGQNKRLELVHRDIKPSNLILNPQGVVKVLDFGIARGGQLTEKPGSVKGTWGYMAPEQAVGDETGPQADVFGLGIVLYEMASGTPLFRDKKPGEIKRLLLDDHAVRMAATLDSGRYGPLVNILARSLQRDPSARFPDAKSFAKALSALLPDPVTARDEVILFHNDLKTLNNGESLSEQQRAVYMDERSSVEPIAPSKAVDTTSSWVTAPLLMLGFVSGALLVGFAFFAFTNGEFEDQPSSIGMKSVREKSTAADERPDPSAVPQEPVEFEAAQIRPIKRPPPAGSVASSAVKKSRPRSPKAQKPVRVVVVRPSETPKVVEAEAVVKPKPVEVLDGMGSLTISAQQPAEVYVDGQFVRKIPLVRREFSAGKHVVTIVATDGRRKSFSVDLEVDQELRKVWDFDRAAWKR